LDLTSPHLTITLVTFETKLNGIYIRKKKDYDGHLEI